MLFMLMLLISTMQSKLNLSTCVRWWSQTVSSGYLVHCPSFVWWIFFLQDSTRTRNLSRNLQRGMMPSWLWSNKFLIYLALVYPKVLSIYGFSPSTSGMLTGLFFLSGKFPTPISHSEDLSNKLTKVRSTIKFQLKKALCLDVLRMPPWASLSIVGCHCEHLNISIDITVICACARGLLVGGLEVDVNR